MYMCRDWISKATMSHWQVMQFVNTWYPADEDEIEDENQDTGVEWEDEDEGEDEGYTDEDPWEYLNLHNTPRGRRGVLELYINLDHLVGRSAYTKENDQAPHYYKFDLKPLLELAIYERRFRFHFHCKKPLKADDWKQGVFTSCKRCAGCPCPNCRPLLQLNKLVTLTRKAGPGLEWAFVLAHAERCDLHRAGIRQLDLEFVINEEFPISNVALWRDTWGFEWNTSLPRPLGSLDIRWVPHHRRLSREKGYNFEAGWEGIEIEGGYARDQTRYEDSDEDEGKDDPEEDSSEGD